MFGPSPSDGSRLVGGGSGWIARLDMYLIADRRPRAPSYSHIMQSTDGSIACRLVSHSVAQCRLVSRCVALCRAVLPCVVVYGNMSRCI